MKTVLKLLAIVLGLALVASTTFYLGEQFIAAFYIRENLATVTVQKVEFLRRFRSDISPIPRELLEDEVANLVFNLDSVLRDRTRLFVDRESVKYARDNALVYFHVFPPDHKLAEGSAQLIKQLEASPVLRGLAGSASIQSLHQSRIATDDTLAALLRDFDASKLDKNNQRFLERLTQRNKSQ